MKFTSDYRYMNIVYDIYNNEEFNKLKKIEHHGITRFEHSMRVSYYSYKISKFLGFDYEKTARAGLLHDFFYSEENRNLKDRFISTFKHPKVAVLNATINFDLDDLEKDIIKSHMFPINKSIPKYAESWIVSFVDKGAAMYEFFTKFLLSFKFRYATNIYILFIMNFIRL